MAMFNSYVKLSKDDNGQKSSKIMTHNGDTTCHAHILDTLGVNWCQPKESNKGPDHSHWKTGYVQLQAL